MTPGPSRVAMLVHGSPVRRRKKLPGKEGRRQEASTGRRVGKLYATRGILNDVAVKVVFPGPGTLASRTVVYSDVRINRRVVLDR